MDSSVSVPWMGSFPEHHDGSGTYEKFSARKEVSEVLDEINDQRAIYLLNTDNALIELYS